MVFNFRLFFAVFAKFMKKARIAPGRWETEWVLFAVFNGAFRSDAAKDHDICHSVAA